MSDNARHLGPALEAHQRFLTWLIPTLEKFPRAQRFLLGDRIEGTALDVLERLIEATYTREPLCQTGAAAGGLRYACPPYGRSSVGA